MAKELTNAEIEILKMKFEKNAALYAEFNGDFDSYLAWFEHEEDVTIVNGYKVRSYSSEEFVSSAEKL